MGIWYEDNFSFALNAYNAGQLAVQFDSPEDGRVLNFVRQLISAHVGSCQQSSGMTPR